MVDGSFRNTAVNGDSCRSLIDATCAYWRKL